MKAHLIIDSQAQLGEGALWYAAVQQLLWVDIEGRAFHTFDPATHRTRMVQLPARVGTVVPTVGKLEVIVALQNGIFSLNLKTEQLTEVTNPLEGQADMRFNDGKCDAAGRFWVGSMHLSAQQPNGTLYRLDPNGELRPTLRGLTISNGITWSVDNETMYFIDSATGTIQSFDYELDTGTFAEGQVAVTVPAGQGLPDGMTIDEEGMLWVAHWGGSSVGRYDPHRGELIQKVDVPAPHVTSCAFGGEHLDTLYITTARKGMDEQQLGAHPLSGSVFAADVGVKGIPAYAYGQA